MVDGLSKAHNIRGHAGTAIDIRLPVLLSSRAFVCLSLSLLICRKPNDDCFIPARLHVAGYDASAGNESSSFSMYRSTTSSTSLLSLETSFFSSEHHKSAGKGRLPGVH